MKNVIRAAVVLVAICVIVSMVTAAPKEIKIGGLFALSGKAAQIGVPTKAVANMVIRDINRKGGIRGAKLVLVPTDTLSEPGQAVVALKKLIAREKIVALVGPTTTGEAMASIPTIEGSKIPTEMCVGGAAPVVPIRPYVFKSPQKSSSAVARIYMFLRSRKMNKIALLTATDKFGEEGEQLLQELAPSYKMSIVAHEKFSPTDQDMSVQIGKIASAKPQAMIVWTIGPAGGLATKNARQLKVPFLIVQCHGQPDPLYLKVAGAAANGSVMPSTRLMVADQLPNSDPQKKVCLSFIKQYKALKIGEYGTHSGYAWDAVQIIANAMRKAGTNPVKLRAAIENTKRYVGVSGIYNLTPKDHTGLDARSLVMVEVRNGKWKLLK